MSSPERPFRQASNLESIRQEIESDLTNEIRQIAQAYPFVGEGKAAKVFSLENTFVPGKRSCVKIWRPELFNLDDVTRAERQSISPKEEFELQDSLFNNGFHNIPRPFAFCIIDEYPAMIMERIPGYTLAEIQDRGGYIVNPPWKTLLELVTDLNEKHHVLHRDLHLGNIILKTEQKLEDHRNKLSGSLYLIDFGVSKPITDSPTNEDYKLTIGENVIKYQSDVSSVRMLQNSRPGNPDVTPFLY